ncbi:MAG: IclR family transcriptional regulator [Dehalobacterium sp.]
MQSVDRIVTILSLLSNAGKGLGITELYTACDLPKSTLHRTLNSLMEHGFVLQDVESKKYRLGPTVLRLGASYLMQNDLRSYARSYLEQLGAELNETVYLTILQDDTAICVDTFGASRNLNYFVHIGREMPFNTTAAAKVILAYQPEELIRKVIYSKKLCKLTEKSIVDPDCLFQHIIEIKECGYGICEEEMEEGVTAIAAPVWNWGNQVTASVAVIGPSVRLQGEMQKNIIEKIKLVAENISRELGWVPAS